MSLDTKSLTSRLPHREKYSLWLPSVDPGLLTARLGPSDVTQEVCVVVRLWGRRRRGSARIWARVREQGEGDCQGRPLSPRRTALPPLSYLTSHLTSSHVTCLSTLIGFLVVSVNTPAAPPTLRSTVISGRVVGRHSNQCPWVEWRQIQFVHLTSLIKTTRFDRSVCQLLVCAPHNQITSHVYIKHT